MIKPSSILRYMMKKIAVKICLFNFCSNTGPSFTILCSLDCSWLGWFTSLLFKPLIAAVGSESSARYYIGLLFIYCVFCFGCYYIRFYSIWFDSNSCRLSLCLAGRISKGKCSVRRLFCCSFRVWLALVPKSSFWASCSFWFLSSLFPVDRFIGISYPESFRVFKWPTYS
jgi:hypothetical protein